MRTETFTWFLVVALASLAAAEPILARTSTSPFSPSLPAAAQRGSGEPEMSSVGERRQSGWLREGNEAFPAHPRHAARQLLRKRRGGGGGGRAKGGSRRGGKKRKDGSGDDVLSDPNAPVAVKIIGALSAGIQMGSVKINKREEGVPHGRHGQGTPDARDGERV